MIQSLQTIKGYFADGSYPSKSQIDDTLDTLAQGLNNQGRVIQASFSGYSGGLDPAAFSSVYTSPYNPYTPLPLSAIKMEVIPRIGIYDHSTSVVLMIHNDGFWQNRIGSSYNNHPFDGAMFVTWKADGGEGTYLTAKVNDTYWRTVNGNYVAEPQIVEIPVGTCAAFVYIGHTDETTGNDYGEFMYIGGGIPRTSAQLTELYNTGAVSSAASVSVAAPSIQKITVGDNVTINNITYNSGYAAPHYTDIAITDIISSYNVDMSNSDFLVIANDGYFSDGTVEVNGSNVPFTKMYVSCGSEVDNSVGITVIDNNSAAMFAKITDSQNTTKYVPVGRAITITPYELSQLQQSSSGSDYNYGEYY